MAPKIEVIPLVVMLVVVLIRPRYRQFSYRLAELFDGLLAIRVLTSAMLSASRYTALERFTTWSASSSNQAYHCTSSAQMAFWTSLSFRLETPMAVSQLSGLRETSEVPPFDASPFPGQFA
jgi:hypothetical protein